MSRLLSAGTGNGPASDAEKSAWGGFSFHDLPSGLASLVIHFTVLIVLGLVVTGSPRPHLVDLNVAWDQGTDELAGGGGGTDGTEDIEDPGDAATTLDEATESLAAAVPASEPLLSDAVTSEWGETTAELTTTSLMSAETGDVFADLATIGESGLKGIGTGGGSGGGTGRSDGPGVGDGIGPGSKTGVFGLRDEGKRIVYAFDRSESMNSVFTLDIGDGRNVSVTFLEAAKEELSKSIAELSNGSQFQMIFYHSFALPYPGKYNKDGLCEADAETKEAAQQFIYELVAERNTNHLDALAMALELKPDVIFLMTDGEAKDDPTTGDIRKIQRIARRSGTRINVIHFVFEDRSNSTLESLAKRTGGQFKMINIRSLIDTKW
jgi:hypothetical protein